MTRRKPKTFTWLEQPSGKKVRGAGGVTEAGISLFSAGRMHGIPELAHRWMSAEKRRTHTRERREGRNEARGD